MHKKLMIIVIGVAIIGATIGWFLFNRNITSDSDFFLQRVEALESISLLTETHIILLTKEDIQILKETIVEQYKKGEFHKDKIEDFGIVPFLFKTNMFNEKLTIAYYPKKKQLVFDSSWFIPLNLSKERLGEYRFKTKDMILVVDTNTEYYLEKMIQNVY